ncbi:TPA: hypothetical protein U1X08_000545 [Streptococcus suis]|uniref:Phage protein n=1 Tax=Streptococcus suis TaxID=1307 RepID=A0A116PKP8_STRSU|nr:hypothetical protein [Streptococcus suis]QBX21190.1 hypothetical protein Javan565_0015 [Streptococcus phage Javan565]AXI65833.1 hypothetical protein DP111_07300 [Streptococcus suis]MBO8111167.1 hypothetical protein [Streptococcus suis]MBS8082918.1 hypothetical protein [Streptococcus suis]MBS8090798.1 hypothetical protein [Streptococcus suis]
MAKLELTLHGENGYEKVIRENYVSGQKLLDYLKMLEEFEKKSGKMTAYDFITRKVEFLASLFTAEVVSPEDILKGVPSWDLVRTVDDLLDKAMGAKGDDPKLESSLSKKLETDT